MNTCWQAFLDTGPLALLPLADPEKVAIVWSLDEAEHERIASLPDEAFLRALNHALGQDAPAAAALGPRASFPLRQAHAVEYIDQGLVLVADAAHSIHPWPVRALIWACRMFGCWPVSSCPAKQTVSWPQTLSC